MHRPSTKLLRHSLALKKVSLNFVNYKKRESRLA